ncbi:MAG: 3-oxoacyl-ACP reductase FabG [Chloroflexi bacterium]|nr:3-oxoacyl-ACP reductase FabG [Chloroflexota bacterium]
MRLKKQVAIVTGAGQGIGRAIALTLVREGATVVVNDIDLEKAEKVAEEIYAQGGQALPVQADVSKAKDVDILVKKTLDSYKRVDILVNNAGVAKMTRLLELTEAEWDRTMNINIKGQFLCSKAVIAQMIKQKRGKIVNIASLAAHIGAPGLAAYGASKGGVVQLTKALAVELGKYNIMVNAVSPGLTMTELIKSAVKDRPDFIEGMDRIPLRRAAEPEDIANAVLFLASSESDYITGQVLIVDGGLMAIHPRMVKPTD